MKTLVRYASIFITLILSFNIYAIIPVGALENNINKVIDSYDLPEYFKSLSLNEKKELVSSIKKDPNTYQSITYFYDVDELSIIQSYVNSTEKELLNKGFSHESIQENSKIIKN